MAELSPAEKRAVWSALEDIEGDLGPIVAWLPTSALKDSLEKALGGLISAQWRLARDLGGMDGDESDRTVERAGYQGVQQLVTHSPDVPQACCAPGQRGASGCGNRYDPAQDSFDRGTWC